MPRRVSVVDSMGAADPAIAVAILPWYDVHARRLPWRAPPGTTPLPPYHTWLSEMMLQQTTVAAVQPYFQRFVARWPDVAALASTPEDAVMAAWAGLGYYRRARAVHATAQIVAGEHGGRFPDEEDALRRLPGLGAYTAAAIAAIAFGRRAVVIDGNVARIVARLAGLTDPLPAARRAIRAVAERITPIHRPGDFAQAMMDLGATVCTTRAPRCGQCPLAPHCVARLRGLTSQIPAQAPRLVKPVRRGTAFWIESTAGVWLGRRPGKGVLAGMLALPDDGWSSAADGTSEPPLHVRAWHRPARRVRHMFTHFTLDLGLAMARVEPADMKHADGMWCPRESLATTGLPSLFVKAVKVGEEEGSCWN